MIDLKILRENPEIVRAALTNRGVTMDLEKITALDAQRRALVTEIQTYKQQRNEISQKIGTVKQHGKEPAELMNKARELNKIIKEKETEEKEIACALDKAAQWLPNIPHSTVPVGAKSADNQFIRGLTKSPAFNFQVLKHWEIADALNILDLKRTPKISGSRFITYTGVGARLERALINFFLDLHTTKHGYVEIMPPVLNPESTLYGTGQLPKLESDMYKCRDDELYLTPTAEVPLTNFHSGEIIPEKKLPICYVAYTPCFRREAGSYGKDVRGIKRVHQFNKVELVKYAVPDNGYAEFERLLGDAETAVRLLGLPYRIMLLCTGEMTFAAAKTYDIEVYAAGLQEWLEVSSVSIYEQYQARRANIRFRKARGKVDYVYTMNGSGLATPRVFIAIVENFQTQDGRIKIPEVLRPYMDGLEYIE